MSRLVHFVGSIPPEVNPDPRQGMEWIVGRTRPAALSTLPCDAEPRWIADFIVGLADRPALETVRSGQFLDYDDAPLYRVARGAKLTPSDLDMNRRDSLRAQISAYRELVARQPGLAETRHQLSLPAPLDLSMFTFGRTPALLKGARVYGEALAAEVAELHDGDSDVLVWQLETPTVLIALNSVPRPVRGVVARILAHQLAGFIARLPEDTALVLHLCYGNLADKEFIAPSSMDGVDIFLNALRKSLVAAGRAVPPVHIPSAYGANPPFTDPGFYTALSRVNSDWPLIAGIVDEDNPEASAKALTLFESASGRTCHAVATACGLGRHSPDAAARAAALMIELADS